jgi:hypothetical protein
LATPAGRKQTSGLYLSIFFSQGSHSLIADYKETTAMTTNLNNVKTIQDAQKLFNQMESRILKLENNLDGLIAVYNNYVANTNSQIEQLKQSVERIAQKDQMLA